MKLNTVFCLNLIMLVASLSSAHAQTFSVIHTFTGQNGADPQTGLTMRAGILYGTTVCVQYCSGAGTVYQISHLGSQWIYTPISLFSEGGSSPQARVMFGPDNQLYGTTASGGVRSGGIVFNLTPPVSVCKTANCSWKEKIVHEFTGNPDGFDPGPGDLAWDSMGNMYGTTRGGGLTGEGTVFQITKSGNNWTEKPLYSFAGSHGQEPNSGVILDNHGNLFGTTFIGGLYNAGTVFELTYVNGIGWTETVLYNFQNLSDGQLPIAGLVRDSAGNLYGATSGGGSGGGGTVFALTPVGNTWAFSVLYSFSGGGYSGPWVALTMDQSGNLFGTTHADGVNRLGSVFKLTHTPNGWDYTSLHDFTGSADGDFPISNVTIDANGNLYGTASLGADTTCNPPVGCGTVWMIKP